MSTFSKGFEQSSTNLSWSPIFAGVVATIGLSLILTTFSAGMGFSTLSASLKKSATGLTIIAALWITIIQWIPAALGGYVAGKYGSDGDGCSPILHGFLTWVISTLISASVLTSIFISIVIGTAKFAAINTAALVGLTGATAGGVISSVKNEKDDFKKGGEIAEMADEAKDYITKHLFGRDAKNKLDSAVSSKAVQKETERIIIKGIKTGEISEQDKESLMQTLSEEAGISAVEANKRINEGVEKMKEVKKKVEQVADKTRKAVEGLIFFLFFSLVVGAAVSCIAAIYGSKKA